MTIVLHWGERVSTMSLHNVEAVWSCSKKHSPQDSQTTVLFKDGHKCTWWGAIDVSRVEMI